MSYSREQLKESFDMVCNPDDWRAPIKKIIPVDDLDVTINAIMFFAGTQVNTRYLKNDLCEVSSVGYRNGPCGP